MPHLSHRIVNTAPLATAALHRHSTSPSGTQRALHPRPSAAMAFAAIHNHNPFVVPGLFFLALLLARQFFASRPGRLRPLAQKAGNRSIMVLGALLGVCVVLAPAFEYYFRSYHCEVSEQYMAENLVIARKVMQVLAAHGIPYWVDYASLLNVLRDQQLNSWEQDVDLSIIHPAHMHSLRAFALLPGGGEVGPALDRAVADPDAPGLPLTREHLMDKMRAAGFQATFSTTDGRELIQLWGPIAKGPHVDIWMWAPIPEGTTGWPAAPAATPYTPSAPPLLWTGEDAHYNPRPMRAIFPLGNTTWLGVTASIPADPHDLSKGEFGRYGGSYMQAQVFRGDCFHNFFQLRFVY